MTHRLGSRLKTAVAVGAAVTAAAAAGAGMCFDVPESEEKFDEERESY